MVTMVARIARLFGQALPTDISVTVETALDLKVAPGLLGRSLRRYESRAAPAS